MIFLHNITHTFVVMIPHFYVVGSRCMGAVQERLPWHSMEETYIFSGLLQAHDDDDLFGTAGE